MACGDDFPVRVLAEHPRGEVARANFRLSRARRTHPQQARLLSALDLIDGHLSEFNIMVDEERVWLIDWPQWIEPSHPNADTILRRDIDNLVNYFSKKYGLSATTDEVLNLVVG